MTVCVVDPGVGNTRGAVALSADGRWFVGPDNGLMSVVAVRSAQASCYDLDTFARPLSASFHGRDLFAPHAAALARARGPSEALHLRECLNVELNAGDLPKIVHIDRYGNAITGIRAASTHREDTLRVQHRLLRSARVLSEHRCRRALLVQEQHRPASIAANQTSAATLLVLLSARQCASSGEVLGTVSGRKPIFTVGHGNRTLDEFLTLLERVGIQCLVDVRAFPGSRRHPQFGREALQNSLAGVGVEYVWDGEAPGGRRRARGDSPHVAIRNASFRAYADHMESDVFRSAAQSLLERGARENIAIMCAERLPWQCHRYMIADYLVAAGAEVSSSDRRRESACARAAARGSRDCRRSGLRCRNAGRARRAFGRGRW